MRYTLDVQFIGTQNGILAKIQHLREQSSWAWVPKSMSILMKLGRNFSRSGLFLVVYEGGVLKSLAEVSVMSGVVCCTGFCMDGTGKLAATRVGREVQVHSSSY